MSLMLSVDLDNRRPIEPTPIPDSQAWTVPLLTVSGEEFLEGISVVPLGSRMKTLPGRDTAVNNRCFAIYARVFVELCPFPALLDELSCQRFLAHNSR